MPKPFALKHQHPWRVSLEQASAIQVSLQSKVLKQDRLPKTLRFVAGVDVGFENRNSVTRAAVAVLTFPQLQLHEYSIARMPTEFPYVPGYLSFREVPAVLAALRQLKTLPDILLCDGQGVAHPRRMGVASHLGVLTDIPSIGVAKSRLIGEHKKLAVAKGGFVELIDKGEVIGAVVRTRHDVNPLYVSVGHRVSLPTAINIVFQCVTKYRLPETTRWADRIASNRNGRYA